MSSWFWVPQLLKLVYFSFYWKKWKARLYQIFCNSVYLTPYLCYFTCVTRYSDVVLCPSSRQILATPLAGNISKLHSRPSSNNWLVANSTTRTGPDQTKSADLSETQVPTRVYDKVWSGQSSGIWTLLWTRNIQIGHIKRMDLSVLSMRFRCNFLKVTHLLLRK